MRAAMALTALLALGCAGCQMENPWPKLRAQRWPAPMSGPGERLAGGPAQAHPPGPEEVLVIRHADPVQIRPAGMPAAFPMRHHDKERRVNAGSWVFSAPGGRAEVLWPDGASIVLFGRATGLVGSPTRGEPTFRLIEGERATIMPLEGARFELMGGSILEAPSGPYKVVLAGGDTVRVTNQSKRSGEIWYREEILRLEPGQTVDLPLLDGGCAPTSDAPPEREVRAAGVRARVDGRAELRAHPQGIVVTAAGDHEVRALGIRLVVGEGERAFIGQPGGPVSFEEAGEVLGDGDAPPLAPPQIESAPPEESSPAIEKERR